MCNILKYKIIKENNEIYITIKAVHFVLTENNEIFISWHLKYNIGTLH